MPNAALGGGRQEFLAQLGLVIPVGVLHHLARPQQERSGTARELHVDALLRLNTNESLPPWRAQVVIDAALARKCIEVRHTFVVRAQGICVHLLALPGAAAARELLAARGLGAATITEVEDLLKKLPTVREPPSPIGPTLEEQTVAENAMRDWYLEWAQIARATP